MGKNKKTRNFEIQDGKFIVHKSEIREGLGKFIQTDEYEKSGTKDLYLQSKQNLKDIKREKTQREQTYKRQQEAAKEAIEFLTEMLQKIEENYPTKKWEEQKEKEKTNNERNN